MLGDITAAGELYIVTGYTDMRKSIDGLCAIVEDQLHMDPRRSALYLFCGKRGDRVKALTLKTESESIMNNISKISGIPITREKSNSSILFTTAKKFKGLESRVIIIVDIDESSFNDEKEKRNFYVACSRATQYLSLIVEGDDQKIKSIADVIAGPNFAPKGKIAMKTQATPLRLD